MITFQALTHNHLTCPFCGRELKKLKKSWETARADMEDESGEIAIRRGEKYCTGYYIETCECGAEYSYTVDFPPFWEQAEDKIYYQVENYNPETHRIDKNSELADDGMYIRKTITGPEMKFLRKKILKMTQTALAEALGYRKNTIWMKETGRRSVSFRDAVKIKKMVAGL